jgi:hypothetical protein
LHKNSITETFSNGHSLQDCVVPSYEIQIFIIGAVEELNPDEGVKAKNSLQRFKKICTSPPELPPSPS